MVKRNHREQVAAYGAARETVLRRARGRCESCGRRLDIDTLHFHHRKARSAGRDDSPSNGLALCARCHGWTHGHVTAAREAGLIVPSWNDPAEVPVVLRDGCWLLEADGTRKAVDAATLPLFNGGKRYTPRKVHT